MTLKKAYQYLFYKLYKFYDTDSSMWWSSNWWSDWKASFSLLVLEVWLLVSFVVYYEVITKRELLPENILDKVAIAVVIILAIVKYFAFEHRDRWKELCYRVQSMAKEEKQNRHFSCMVDCSVHFRKSNLCLLPNEPNKLAAVQINKEPQ